MSLTKNQKQVLNFIENYLAENGYSPTQKEIKDHFELKSYGSVQRYLKYLKEGGYLETDWNQRRGIRPLTQEPLNIEIPLVGDIAAGNPTEAIENTQEKIEVPPSLVPGNHCYFALRIKGESMIEEGIFENDIVIIKKQNQARSGQIIAAIIDGEATLKKYRPKDGFIELVPANKDFAVIKVNPSEKTFGLAGILVGLLRSYH
ncbi:MAG: repressor LexA [Epsilonproteobacteria bacterium]|nr:MAG: repressor LexA [Campylobacterota bacterium]RLA65758.1 MAG: repressor LexA [Campylobacterota bacterium]